MLGSVPRPRDPSRSDRVPTRSPPDPSPAWILRDGQRPIGTSGEQGGATMRVVPVSGGTVKLGPSAGGLVAALSAAPEPRLWVGWPGAAVTREQEQPVAAA